jgi:hypothetical protein
MGYRSFGTLDATPVQAVGTVEQVTRLGPVPAERRRSNAPERYYEARVLVRRAFFHTEPHRFAQGDRIAIRYVSADPPIPFGASGGGGSSLPPVVVTFQKGETSWFPLVPWQPASGRWDLAAGDGWRTVFPAAPDASSFAAPPRTARGFALREMANTLTHGTARERSGAVIWLSAFAGDVPPELPRLLRAALGGDDDKWLETGCAFLGLYGAPQDDQAALTYGEASPPFHRVRDMVTWILWKGDRRDYPNRLIRRLLRHSGDYAWGAANALVQYKDSTVLIDGLNRAMRRNAAGSITIAYFIVKAGQQAVAPEALDLAVRLVNRAAVLGTGELPAAAQLIVTDGDDRHFDALAAALGRFKRENENAYRDLWGAAAFGSNRRGLRLAAILLDDRRPGFVTFRYCDVAAGAVAALSGQNFGISRDMPLAGRDRAVARASAWIAAQQRSPEPRR